jgi:hypothetical protein
MQTRQRHVHIQLLSSVPLPESATVSSEPTTTTMRCTPIRLVRVLQRSAVPANVNVVAEPAPTLPVSARKTLMEHLLERRAAAGSTWPSNIRLEQPIARTAYKKLDADVRRELKDFLREQ